MYARHNARGAGGAGRRASHRGGNHRHAGTERESPGPAPRCLAPAPPIAVGIPGRATARGGDDRSQPEDPARARGRLPAWQLAARAQPRRDSARASQCGGSHDQRRAVGPVCDADRAPQTSRLEPRGPRRTGEAQNPVERAARGGSRPVRAAGAAALPPTVAFRDVRPFHLSASGQSTAHLNVLTGYRHRSHATFPALRSDPFAAPPRDTRVAARALKATGGRTPAADRAPSSGATGSSPAGLEKWISKPAGDRASPAARL